MPLPHPLPYPPTPVATPGPLPITAVLVKPVPPGQDPRVEALASITLADCFVVRDIRVVRTRSGRLLVAMPQRRTREGTYRDLAFPACAAARLQIEAAILGEFDRVAAEAEATTNRRAS